MVIKMERDGRTKQNKDSGLKAESSRITIKYYPDDLMLDEDVLFSSKYPILPIYYYATTKRIFFENKITKKKTVLEYEKVSDIHIEQNKFSRILNRGNIIVMHSNYKKDVPLMRRKYFYLKNVKNLQECFNLLKKRI